MQINNRELELCGQQLFNNCPSSWAKIFTSLKKKKCMGVTLMNALWLVME
ncbi:fructosamine kinase family domain protein [Vibrio cholerae HC-02A1]|nr:fructosamine kinase family domain protein [Vibrio cholerae HC-02A1]